MDRVKIEYPWRQSIETIYQGDDVAAAIQTVREIFQGKTAGRMAAGFVTLEHDGKRVAFPTDGGISFHHWEKNEGGPWGSQEEFLRATDHEAK